MKRHEINQSKYGNYFKDLEWTALIAISNKKNIKYYVWNNTCDQIIWYFLTYNDSNTSKINIFKLFYFPAVQFFFPIKHVVSHLRRGISFMFKFLKESFTLTPFPMSGHFMEQAAIMGFRDQFRPDLFESCNYRNLYSIS